MSCKEALEAFPRSSLAHLLLGKLLERSNKLAEGLKAYSTALSLNPSSPSCATSKAEMLASLDRKQEAIDLYVIFLASCL